MTSKERQQIIKSAATNKERRKLAQLLCVGLGAEVGVAQAVASALEELLGPAHVAIVEAVIEHYTEDRFA